MEIYYCYCLYWIDFQYMQMKKNNLLSLDSLFFISSLSLFDRCFDYLMVNSMAFSDIIDLPGLPAGRIEIYSQIQSQHLLYCLSLPNTDLSRPHSQLSFMIEEGGL